MHVRAISTFTDWTAMSGCWGRTGVCRIFEQLRIAGIRDVYWRVFNGGLAMYPSRVAEAQGRQVYDFVVAHDEYPFSNRPVHYVREVDFNRYDSLPDAFEVAEEFGINLHLWYSIYEDEHGRAYQSKLNADLPHCRHTDREGRQYSGTFDWYYPEIRDYKLAIIDELLAYPAKGIMLDLVRHNATASADANGIHRFGYNPEIRAAFKEAHGADPLELTADDPEWLAFKTEIRTSLIREIRHRMDRRGNALELSLMLWPLDYLPWACIDVPALTGEGAVQMLAGFSLTYSMSPDEARLHMDVLKRQCGGEDVLIMPGLSSYGGLTSDHVDVFAQAAEEAGAPGVMLYEADSLVKFDITPAVRVINAGRPRYKRSLQAGRVAAADAPWDTVPVFDDFLYHFGQNPDEVPSERTSVRLAFNDEALMIRFECDDRDMAAALAPEEANAQHQYYIDALRHRSPYFERNTFNVIVDPRYSGRDFHQFGVTPKGEQVSAMFIDENWTAPWDAQVTAEENRWVGTITIPYASLGCSAPQPGDVWGANLVRGIRSKGEINMWSPISGQQTCPYELIRLEFQE